MMTGMKVLVGDLSLRKVSENDMLEAKLSKWAAAQPCCFDSRQRIFNFLPLSKLLRAQDFLLTLISSEANYQVLF